MSDARGTARLDDRGRLVLPKELRRRLGLRPGDEVTISEQADGVLRLESPRVAARALIGSALHPLGGTSGSASDSMVQELHEERRQQAAAEDRQARREQA